MAHVSKQRGSGWLLSHKKAQSMLALGANLHDLQVWQSRGAEGAAVTVTLGLVEDRRAAPVSGCPGLGMEQLPIHSVFTLGRDKTANLRKITPARKQAAVLVDTPS